MDVAMVSSSGSLCDRRDRAGLGPRGSKPLAFGLFFFGGEGEGVFTSSSTFAVFLKSRAKRPGFGGLATSPSTTPGVAGGLGERGIGLGLLGPRRGCLSCQGRCVVVRAKLSDAASAPKDPPEG
jgi:hypothetical protein